MKNTTSYAGHEDISNFYNKILNNVNIFPGGSGSKESACIGGDPIRSLGQKDPLKKRMATHSSSPAG